MEAIIIAIFIVAAAVGVTLHTLKWRAELAVRREEAAVRQMEAETARITAETDSYRAATERAKLFDRSDAKELLGVSASTAGPSWSSKTP